MLYVHGLRDIPKKIPLRISILPIEGQIQNKHGINIRLRRDIYKIMINKRGYHEIDQR